MKKIYLTLGIVTGLALTSCSDFLDKEPSTALPEEKAIETVGDLQNAVNGVVFITCYPAHNKVPRSIYRVCFLKFFAVF